MSRNQAFVLLLVGIVLAVAVRSFGVETDAFNAPNRASVPIDPYDLIRAFVGLEPISDPQAPEASSGESSESQDAIGPSGQPAETAESAEQWPSVVNVPDVVPYIVSGTFSGETSELVRGRVFAGIGWNASDLFACYSHHMAQSRINVDGLVTLGITVGQSGLIEAVEVTRDELNIPGMGECLKEKLSGLQIVGPLGHSEYLEYTLLFFMSGTPNYEQYSQGPANDLGGG